MSACTRAVDAALVSVSTALGGTSEEKLLEALHSEHLDLSDVESANIAYYERGLEEKRKQKPNGRLAEEEVQECINELNAAAELDRLSEFDLCWLRGCGFEELYTSFHLSLSSLIFSFLPLLLLYVSVFFFM